MSPLETLNQVTDSMSSQGPRQLVKGFGKKLRALRLERSITLKDLAKELGYRTHSHLSAIESGAKVPTVELVVRVSRFFNVSTDILLNDDAPLNTIFPTAQSR